MLTCSPRRLNHTWTIAPGDIQGETGTCGIEVSYHASPWELSWLNTIQALQSDDFLWTKGCEEMRDARWKVDHWLTYWKYVHRNPSESLGDGWDPEIFSYHQFTDTCTNRELKKIPIEPLVGTLRHPLAVCDATVRRDMLGRPRRDSRARVNKEYMIETRRREFLESQGNSSYTKGGRSLFFDIGASTYHDGKGGPSLSWFIDTYHHAGFDFDRVLGWEARKLEAFEIFEGMPFNLLKTISYFNLPVESDSNSDMNPWRYIRSLARREDFVVVKLDIDTPAVEIELMRQILFDEPDSNSPLSELIDELYFEHHVWGSGMTPDWTIERLDGDMKGSYSLFAALRLLGIRAHSWV